MYHYLLVIPDLILDTCLFTSLFFSFFFFNFLILGPCLELHNLIMSIYWHTIAFFISGFWTLTPHVKKWYNINVSLINSIYLKRKINVNILLSWTKLLLVISNALIVQVQEVPVQFPYFLHAQRKKDLVS